ncbi:MAG: hypothetical protein ACYCYF_08535 [Anaerolineae bacterium]
MDDALELVEYMPVFCRNQAEQDYIEFLWDAFQTNYDHGKNQFAFLAYHMLTMSFVYFNLWQIRTAYPGDFQKGLIGFTFGDESFLTDATTPYSFSKVNERTVLRLLQLIGCDREQIKRYASLVDKRNDMAHPNGSISFLTEELLAHQIREILGCVRQIEEHSRPVIERIYTNFLGQSIQPENREYELVDDQVREVLIKGNYLSACDAQICLALDVSTLVDAQSADSALELHSALLRMYGPD